MPDESSLANSYQLRSDEETQSYYDRWAATYDDELSAQGYAQPIRCAAALADRVADRSLPVLDAGCGTGLSGVALRAQGFSVIDGCDFSTEMLARAEALGIYRTLFEANLNEPIAVPDDSYGGVAAVGVFSFGHIQAEALDQLARVTRPGGAVVIGINAKFYDEGSVPARLERLEAEGVLTDVVHEHGDHIPGFDMTGWVMTATVV